MNILIIAVLTALSALLAIYAAILHTRLDSERKETRRLRDDDERFKAIAADILEDSRRSLSHDTSRRLSDLLTPLQSSLETFGRTVEDKYSREAAERFALREKIDELRQLNAGLTSQARNLADALRGNGKIQGDWGEMILQSLLEQAGLTEGVEFTVQQTRDETGATIKGEDNARLRPDVVVRFPGQGCVVIDSKTSLTAYVNYCEASTPRERREAAGAHILSVRRHIDELARKNYQDFIGAGKRLDFVLMFIPNEGAYIAAMQTEPDLWQEAYARRVLLISPTHLLTVLKLIEQMWRHDAQTRNALEIAEEAGRMYDKFAAFVDDLREIERTLGKASDACSTAMNKLADGRGNLMARAQKLRTLGAKATRPSL